MQLPPDESNYRVKVRFGLYVLARLLQENLMERAEIIKASTHGMKAAGRHWEDKDDDTIEPRAVRSHIDGNLDDSARDTRRELASRHHGADKESPYTDIFHSGVAYYTDARIDQEVKRYTELIDRVEANLPEDDAVRVTQIPAITLGVAQYEQASKALDKADIVENMARTDLKKAEANWARDMVKLYGFLIEKFGRAKAERFFT